MAGRDQSPHKPDSAGTLIRDVLLNLVKNILTNEAEGMRPRERKR